MVGSVLWLLHAPLVAFEGGMRDQLLAALKDVNDPALAALQQLVLAKSEAHGGLNFHGQAFEPISWEADIASHVPPAAELNAALEICPRGQRIRCARERSGEVRVSENLPTGRNQSIYLP